MRALLLLTLLLLSSPTIAGQRHYLAALDQSEWLHKADAGSCYLSHPIPRFGVALFSVNQALEFHLRLLVDWPAATDGTAELHLTAPHWRSEPEQLVRKVRYRGERDAFLFNHYISRQLFTALEQGRRPALRFADWFRRGAVQVSLSPVYFRQASMAFDRCVRRLVAASPEGYGGHANLLRAYEPPPRITDQEPPRLYFATDNAGLDRPAMERLEEIAQELLHRSAWDRVLISGHADVRGSVAHNRRLSLQRAREARDYLVKLGLHPARIQIRAHGEAMPAKTGPRPLDLAANRRVVLEIETLTDWEKASDQRALNALRLLHSADATTP
ncbi:OmpA family protein [Alkalilimnicola sp. S0819]|uniref:MotY family protein n=1 Tax=Alkalilimnicola sp. S0819 TaxID=2613922 RepID=UPI00186A98F9|nr:OmpA family protein [Alkalilimnicola sp. S0819]